MIEQLVGQGYLQRENDFSTLSLTESARRVLRGEETPALVKPLVAAKKKEIVQKTRAIREKEWAGVDEELFQLLRQKRAELARRQGVPPFIIFGDRSLKEMAAVRPATRDAFATVYGVGDYKMAAYAEIFLDAIREYAQREGR
jgi:ATP-dependent DNA helicase RecQ